MTSKLSAPIRAFAVIIGLGTLATPALAQTAFENATRAPQQSFGTEALLNNGVRPTPTFRNDSRAFYYGGARSYVAPSVAGPHSAAGTGGGEGGDSGSGGATEGFAE